MSYRKISKVVRETLGVSRTPYPIEFVDGFDAPKLVGRSYHWTTKTGKPVYHPNAYRRAYGNPIYHHSTRRIIVGAGWVIQNTI